MERTAGSTLNRRLRLPFVGITLSLVATLGLALVATARLSDLLHTTTAQTLPEMHYTLRISEQGGLLAASLPVLVASQDHSTLEQQWASIQASVRDIGNYLERLEQSEIAGSARSIIATDVHDYTQILGELRQATAERLDLDAELSEQLSQVRAIHANLSDAIGPVMYGVSSLSRLLARREARRLSGEIQDRFALARTIRQALETVRDRLIADADEAEVRAALAQLAEVVTETGTLELAPPRLILRAAADAQPLTPAQRQALLTASEDAILDNMSAWRGFLNSKLEGLRLAIPALLDESLADMAQAFDLKAEGNLLLALLVTATKVDQLSLLANLNDRANRTLASFRQAAKGFAETDLAQRNPVLANTIDELDGRLSSTLDPSQGIFGLRRRQLGLAERIDHELTAARDLANRLTERIGTIIGQIERNLEDTRARVLRERNLTFGFLFVVCLVGLGLSFLIALVARRALRRDELALIRARDEAEQANRIIEAVAYAARHLLGAAHWEEALGPVLARLGEATGSIGVEVLQQSQQALDDPLERCFYWRRSPAPGADTDSHQDQEPVTQGQDQCLDLTPWLPRLMNAHPALGTIEEVPQPGRARLEADGIRSLLIVPIFVNRTWWGGICFFDREPRNDWPKRFEEALIGAADTLGSAIAQEGTERQLRQAAAVFEDTKEAVIIADAKIRILAVNRAFSAITGYSAAEIVGYTPEPLISEEQRSTFFRRVWRQLQGKGQWQGEIVACRKERSKLPGWLSISRIENGPGKTIQYVAILSDITAIKQSEQQLAFLAQHDALTRLPNRLLLNDRLHRAVARTHRSGQQLAVLFLDLDRFKNINDSLGHEIGDLLLKEVAHRLIRQLRETDTVARLGGDEFILLIEEVTCVNEVVSIAQQLLVALQQPHRIAGRQLFISASIGISLCPEHGDNGEALIRNADAAMYEAKASGKNTFRFYAASMTEAAIARLALENDLRGALERGELELFYQPQCDASSGRIMAFEALLRWRQGDTGNLIPPDRFLPAAEDAGLMIPIGTWVLEQACRDCRAWRNAGFDEIRVAVNVASVQLEQGDMLSVVRKALAAAELPGSAVEMELTESSVMQRLDEIREIFFDLRKLGVTLAIDDFGTGYSSLSYLKRLPFSIVKIDRSFVGDIPMDTNDMAIAHAIVLLAHRLQMTVVAEGVETPEQLEFLRGVECETIQGYLFSPAVPSSAVLPLLQSMGTKANGFDLGTGRDEC